MSWLSVSSYTEDDLKHLQEAAGVTQFDTTGNGWLQVINGLLIQGSIAAAPANGSVVVPFQQSYPLQILGIFVQPLIAGIGNGYGTIDPAGTNLNQFTLVNTGAAKSYFWWAIGV
jgi:hypothetical protein